MTIAMLRPRERSQTRAGKRIEICRLVGERLDPACSAASRTGSRQRRFVGVMDRHDSVQQVLVRGVVESCVGRASASALSATDALRSIRRDSDRRLHRRSRSGRWPATTPETRRIRPPRRVFRFGELEHEQPAVWPQHAVHFRQCALLARHVAQAEAHGDAVEARVGERQRFGVCRQNATFVRPLSNSRSRPTSIIAPLMSARTTLPVSPTSGAYTRRSRPYRRRDRGRGPRARRTSRRRSAS